MSTKHDRMMGQITKHGFDLARIFNLDSSRPVTLCKRVHRLEVKAHYLAEVLCTRQIEEEEEEKQDKSILKSLDKILNFKAQNIPVFLNKDPRGYALKIDDAYVREHKLDIYHDWGGYGIIAPEFDGRN